MQQLKGKVAVVTGAASGIGLAMAKRFAAEGMKLAMVDIEARALEKATSELPTNTEAATFVTDVASAEQMDALGKAVIARFGAVHVVCNNAGVSSGSRTWKASVKEWEWVLGVNLFGVIHGIRVFGPLLLAQNEGHIVNTASVAGLLSPPGMGPYNVSKHAVVTLSETLFHELKIERARSGCRSCARAS
jgi:NADP-dependent 3-hydroxy acid dehydrogenase YdfG